MDASRKIKYAYICEHCGHRNEKFYKVSDTALEKITTYETKGNIRTTTTTTYSDEYNRDLLRERLYAPDLGKINSEQYLTHYGRFNSKCSNCKKRQSWNTQFFYNISFVLIAISILLVVLTFTECFGSTGIIIIFPFLGGVILLLAVIICYFFDDGGVLASKLAEKRVKSESSIPEIVEVGEIIFKDSWYS